MSIILPSIPSELSAATIAAKITEKNTDDNRAKALKLHDTCLKEIKKLVFPCDVYTNSYPLIVVGAVIKSLTEAGYKAQCLTKEVILDHQGTDKRVFIEIDNPLIEKR